MSTNMQMQGYVPFTSACKWMTCLSCLTSRRIQIGKHSETDHAIRKDPNLSTDRIEGSLHTCGSFGLRITLIAIRVNNAAQHWLFDCIVESGVPKHRQTIFGCLKFLDAIESNGLCGFNDQHYIRSPGRSR